MDADILTDFRHTRRVRRSAWGTKDSLYRRRPRADEVGGTQRR